MIKGMILALGLLVAGCAGLASPRGVDDSLVYAQGQVTATRQACLEAGSLGELEKDDIRVCIDSTDKANAAIDVARGAGSVAEKESGLAIALEVLKTAQALLRERK
jgi:hypothetical protein